MSSLPRLWFSCFVLLRLAVERRAADAELAGGLGHPAAVVREREADHVGLDVGERADLAGCVEQRQARRLLGDRVHACPSCSGTTGASRLTALWPGLNSSSHMVTPSAGHLMPNSCATAATTC